MINELLLLIEKHTDTLIEQTKAKRQETLELKLNKQMQVFSFNPSINLSEERKCLLAVTLIEATISVFNNASENNSFSISRPGCWSSRAGAKTIHKQRKNN